MAAILRARYVGRPEKSRDTLLLLQREKNRLDSAASARHAKMRAELASRARALRARTKKNCERMAARQSQRSLVQELMQLNARFKEALHDAQNDCIQISLQVTESVLAASSPELSRTLPNRIMVSLAELRDASGIIVEVHPDDVEAASKSLSSRLYTPPLEVRACDGVVRGKARLVTAVGSILIDWQDHLEHLKAELKTAARKARLHMSRK
ncbi:MAG: hypothetical protein J0M12_13935 [Deltaproteobacteria bacterium]|nr:hypothetical protein [Deltaproteobacteria bacterium]